MVDVGGQSVAPFAIVVPHPPGGQVGTDAWSIGVYSALDSLMGGIGGDGALGELFLRLGMVS